jgi:HPr kinase/phosphorylase
MPQGTLLHASCVAMAGRGLLILGPSGAGKSALALQLMALGARLVADDQTELALRDGALIARAPVPIRGLIEARGVGLLRAPVVEEAEVVLVADLGQREDQRLPPWRKITILGKPVDLVLRAESDHFPAALMLYLAQGRQA